MDTEYIPRVGDRLRLLKTGLHQTAEEAGAILVVLASPHQNDCPYGHNEWRFRTDISIDSPSYDGDDRGRYWVFRKCDLEFFELISDDYSPAMWRD